jgi:hypothetical protein
MSEHSAESGAPTCRACYAATLTPDQRERFNAEPVTSCVYLCPEHDVMNERVAAMLADLVIVDAKVRGYDFATTRDIPPEVGEA